MIYFKIPSLYQLLAFHSKTSVRVLSFICYERLGHCLMGVRQLGNTINYSPSLAQRLNVHLISMMTIDIS